MTIPILSIASAKLGVAVLLRTFATFEEVVAKLEALATLPANFFLLDALTILWSALACMSADGLFFVEFFSLLS